MLVINSGSSSIKYELFDTQGERSLLKGQMTGLSGFEHEYEAGVLNVLSQVQAALPASVRLDAIGHRVVHGGPDFTKSVVIDGRVEKAIDAQWRLAPLHNPPNLAGIRAVRQALPSVPQVAVFDTAFHHTIPPIASIYALPQPLRERYGIRRYGFHGINCAWCLSIVAAHYGRATAGLNLIVAHLGAGSSVTAIRGGHSVDTSMGMTPLEGLVMQTRSGDIDPGIITLLARGGISLDEVDRILNRESGMVALSGTADMKAIEGRSRCGDIDAVFSRELFAYRLRKYICAYASVAWPLDAIVFTAGIGENDPDIRALVCAGLRPLAVDLDAALNQKGAAAQLRVISSVGSAIDVLVVKADEERQIARDTVATISSPS